MSYYTLITKKGARALVSASSNGDKMNLTHIAVGDANGSAYEPTEAATSLRNEVWRGEISNIAPHEDDAAWLVIEAVIGQADGGFSVREVGVFDDDGNLFAIGKFPETYKPQISDGAGKELLLRLILQVSNAANINLTLSGRAVATHEFVADKVLEHNTDSRAHANLLPDASTENKGKVELATLSETTTGTDDDRAVTPYGLKWALPTLVPDASTYKKGKVRLATSYATQKGTDEASAVTPAVLKEALATLVPSASVYTEGKVKLATDTETKDGTDDDRAVTPYGLKYALPTLMPDAGTYKKGKVALATLSETQKGSDEAIAVTPAALKEALPTLVPDAGTETKGKVELATPSETTAGTSAVRAVTPAGLKSALESTVPTLVPDAGTETKGKVELATSLETKTGTDFRRAVTPGGLKYVLAGKEYIRLGPVQNASFFSTSHPRTGYTRRESSLDDMDEWNNRTDVAYWRRRSTFTSGTLHPTTDNTRHVYLRSVNFFHPENTVITRRAPYIWIKGGNKIYELEISYRRILGD